MIVLLGLFGIIGFWGGDWGEWVFAIMFLLMGIWIVVLGCHVRVRLDEVGVTEYNGWRPKRVRWDEVDSVRVRMVNANFYAPILRLRDGGELALESLGQVPILARQPRSRVNRQAEIIRARL